MPCLMSNANNMLSLKPRHLKFKKVYNALLKEGGTWKHILNKEGGMICFMNPIENSLTNNT